MSNRMSNLIGITFFSAVVVLAILGIVEVLNDAGKPELIVGTIAFFLLCVIIGVASVLNGKGVGEV